MFFCLHIFELSSSAHSDALIMCEADFTPKSSMECDCPLKNMWNVSATMSLKQTLEKCQQQSL